MSNNPEVFRSLNQRIAAREGSKLEIVCECTTEGCTERVVIEHAEYDEIRRHERWYVVLPGHEVPQGDRVIEQRPAFVVVAKLANAS